MKGGRTLITIPKLALALLAAGFLADSAFALIEADGTLDLTFDAGNFTNGDVFASILQPDGKLLIAGHFTKVNGVTRQSVARLNSDGTVDPNFDPGAGPDLGANGMVRQIDGKLIIFNGFTLLNGAPRAAGIGRLNSDGSLDAAFDPGRVLSKDGSFDGNGGTNLPGTVSAVVLQTDGKIIVTGQFFFIITGPATSVARSCVARFNSDGSFDPSYDPGSGLVNTPNPAVASGNAVARQSNDKVVIAGQFDQFNGNAVSGLVRLNTDGSYDPSFNPGSTTTPPRMTGLFVQGDDQIIVFGDFTSFSGLARNGIVRLSAANGAVDPGFNTALFKAYADQGFIASVAQQADQKLVVGGLFHTLGPATAQGIVRLNPNGTRDGSFDSSVGIGIGFSVNAFAIRAVDNKIFVGGFFSTYNGVNRNSLALVNPDGSLDNVFAPSGVTDGIPQILAMAVQSDGKILAGGVFTSLNGVPHYNLVRLNPNGSNDNTFAITLGTYGSVRAMLIQSDGKIMIAGQFRAIDSTPISRVARLNPDGTIDFTFNPGTGPDQIVHAITQDSLGNTYIGGDFLNVNGTPRVRIAKLKPDGSLDTAFDPGLGPDADASILPEVRTLAPPTANAGLVLGGSFTSYNGIAVGRIARVDATTAALDTSFTINNGTGFDGNVRAIFLGSGGHYRVGGNFTAFDGVIQRRFLRLNGDGTMDSAFTPAITGGSVFALLRQNGKTFVGGNFATPAKCITRILDDSSADPAFNPGTGAGLSPPNALLGNHVTALALQPDGKLLIGGIFNQYNGTTRITLARLTGPPTITSPLVATGIVGQPFTYQVEATGATSLDATNLPSGLTFNTKLGAITGTPAAAGTFQVGLSATNPAGSTNSILTITVQPAPPSGPVITSSTSATGRTGQSFSFQVLTTGGTSAARLAASGLPPGLVVDPVTGLISGTPASDGSFAVTLTVTDGNLTTSSILQLTFTSDPAIPVIVSSSSATVTAGQPFSYTIVAPAASDPSDPTIFTLIGDLPAGLTFDSKTGTISGIFNGNPVRDGDPSDWKKLSGGIVGNVQLFATNSSGTSTIPLNFFRAQDGAVNISTRLAVGTGNNVLIGGFIITGNAPKKVLIRAIGPSLNPNVPGALQDTALELYQQGTGTLLGTNFDWRDSQENEIIATGIPPTDDREASILATIVPGSYTAKVRGQNDSTGIAVVEVYDLETAGLDASSSAKLAQISTRGTVQTNDDVMIGGFILSGTATKVLVRAIGPELNDFVPGALQDTTLELRDGSGSLIIANDDWRSTQEQDIIDTTVPPKDDRESAVVATLNPGPYTAIVRGKDNTTGVALVEVYGLE